MGTKYSSQSVSGYNATPPSDDGTVSEANKVKWATIKTKLSDPLNTFASAVNSALNTHFDNGPVAVTANTTLGTTHYGQTVQVSGAAVTLTLTDASTLGAGWNCEVVSTDASNTISIARATASNTINETSADISLLPLQTIKAIVNAAATGFLITKSPRAAMKERNDRETFMVGKTLWFAEGADVASAATTDIWTTDGNTVHVTGTTTITSFGTAPQAGAWKWIIFDGALILTHGANLNLQGSANITTAAGDMAHVYADTTTQLDVIFFPKTGNAVVPIPPNIQTFTASGTWTKPSGYNANCQVRLQAWGGGGSGGCGNVDNVSGGGGGGGAYAEIWKTLSELGATETITIGAGGAAVSGAASNGNAGGNTTIGALLTAYGGGRGGGSTSVSNSGGGGAGSSGVGGNATGTTAGTAGAPTGSTGSFGGAAGGAGAAGSPVAGGTSIYGGGGGGGAQGTANTSNTTGTGGNSIYGGGGGGGAATSAGATDGATGGTSTYGGAGGRGGAGTNLGGTGSVPGGGGGGSESTNSSGAGGDGKVIITVFA